MPRSLFKPMFNSSLFFAGRNIFCGFIRPDIDNACHLGGFATGLVLGWLTALPADPAVGARPAYLQPRLGAGIVAGVTALGVALTPRFDYRVRDELAWHEANRGRPAEEQRLIRHNNQELLRFQQTGENAAAYAAWLADTVIPFYRAWLQRLDTLPLQPGRITAGRADIIREVLRIKVAGCQRLEQGVRSYDPTLSTRRALNGKNYRFFPEL